MMIKKNIIFVLLLSILSISCQSQQQQELISHKRDKKYQSWIKDLRAYNNDKIRDYLINLDTISFEGLLLGETWISSQQGVNKGQTTDSVMNNQEINLYDDFIKERAYDIDVNTSFHSKKNFITGFDISPLLSDTFVLDSGIVVYVRRLTKNSVKKEGGNKSDHIFGVADIRNDSAFIAVYVGNEHDIDDLLVFLIYHELQHHIEKEIGKIKSVEQEDKADCGAASLMVRKAQMAAIWLLSSTHKALQIYRIPAGGNHRNSIARAQNIEYCAISNIK